MMEDEMDQWKFNLVAVKPMSHLAVMELQKQETEVVCVL
jgi:hypothetical protein